MGIKRNIKNIFVLTVLGISSMFFINSSMAATKGTIKVETAKLREETNLECKVLELISLNEEVEIIEKTGEWYKVKYDNITGYLREDLVTVKEEPKDVAEGATSDSQTANNETNTEENTNVEDTSAESNADATTDTTTEAPTTDNTQPADQVTEKEENNDENLYGKKKIVEDTKLKIIPSINATDIIDLKKDEEVNVTEVINGWANIETTTNSGWVRTERLIAIEEKEEVPTPQPEEQQAPSRPAQETKIKTQYVNSTTVNLRKEANTSSEIVSTLAINTPVDVYSEENGWSKVKVNDKEGYISSALLSDTKQQTTRSMLTPRTDIESQKQEEKKEEAPNTTPPATPGAGATVVETANKFLGYKYVYGGSLPSTGFDCSGFTSYVFRLHGINLNRTAAGQYSNGVAVSRENLQPGDLVMFGKSGINHVGIYTGGGRMIHAANPSRGVTTDTINSGYYYTNYVGARRVL